MAALCVMVFHRKEWHSALGVFSGSYLAVDFFFMLSGLVVARAYGDKLRSSMSFGEFTRRRVERLYPLIFLSIMLAAPLFLAKFGGRPSTWHRSIPEISAAFLALPAWWLPQGWRLNPPTWSIFFELLINIVFAITVVWMSRRNLVIVLLILAVAFVAFAEHVFFGRPDMTSQVPWNVLRVAFPFTFGVFLEGIHDVGILKRIKLGPLLGSAMIVGSFLIAARAPSSFQLVEVMIILPLIIIGGSNAEPSSKAVKWAQLSGDLSYPLYVLHIPLFGYVAAAAAVVGLHQQPTTLVEAIARFVLVLGCAWIALKAFDEPVRAWFGRRWHRVLSVPA